MDDDRERWRRGGKSGDGGSARGRASTAFAALIAAAVRDLVAAMALTSGPESEPGDETQLGPLLASHRRAWLAQQRSERCRNHPGLQLPSNRPGQNRVH
jgi:hypothetical protein